MGDVDFNVIIFGHDGAAPDFVEEEVFFDDFFGLFEEFKHDTGFFGGEAGAVEFSIIDVVGEVSIF